MIKSVIVLLALSFSITSQAATIRTPCKVADYQVLFSILDASSAVRFSKGAKYKGELVGLLAEEMGPRCDVVSSDQILNTIPGDKTRIYEISSAVTKYTVTYETSIESPFSTNSQIRKSKIK